MKVTVIGSKVAFEPVTLEIQLEELQDLKDLWHRMNVSATTLRNNTDDRFNDAIKVTDRDSSLWSTLDNLATRFGFENAD